MSEAYEDLPETDDRPRKDAAGPGIGRTAKARAAQRLATAATLSRARIARQQKAWLAGDPSRADRGLRRFSWEPTA